MENIDLNIIRKDLESSKRDIVTEAGKFRDFLRYALAKLEDAGDDPHKIAHAIQSDDISDYTDRQGRFSHNLSPMLSAIELMEGSMESLPYHCEPADHSGTPMCECGEPTCMGICGSPAVL